MVRTSIYQLRIWVLIFLTLVGCGLFLLVGEVGLADVGTTYEPSKSLEYCDLNLSLSALAGLGNTFLEETCLSLLSTADLLLSVFEVTTFFCFENSDGGVLSRAVADLVRPSLLRGRFAGSDMVALSWSQSRSRCLATNSMGVSQCVSRPWLSAATCEIPIRVWIRCTRRTHTLLLPPEARE